jgi:hypothetical protein
MEWNRFEEGTVRQLLDCAGVPALFLGVLERRCGLRNSLPEEFPRPSESGAAAPQSKTLRE